MRERTKGRCLLACMLVWGCDAGVGAHTPSEERMYAQIIAMYAAMEGRDRVTLDAMFNACRRSDAGADMRSGYQGVYSLQPVSGMPQCRYSAGKGTKYGRSMRAWCKVKRGGEDYEDFIDAESIHPLVRKERPCLYDFDFGSIRTTRKD